MQYIFSLARNNKGLNVLVDFLRMKASRAKGKGDPETLLHRCSGIRTKNKKPNGTPTIFITL